jgi:hypothetical protein
MENNVRLFSDEIVYHAQDVLEEEFKHDLKVEDEFTIKGETHNGPAAYEQNKRNQVNLGNTMYGLVTTGTEWVLMKLLVEGDTFTAAQSKPFTLPLKEATTSEMLLNGLNLILGRIMWPINEKAKRLSRRC